MFDPLHKWLGIPPSEQPPNDYRLLGIVIFEDDPEVIDGAADKHLAFLHGLSNSEHAEMAEEISNQVSAARLRLLNKEKKAAYDEQLRAKHAAPDEIPPSPDPVTIPAPPTVVPPPVTTNSHSAQPPPVHSGHEPATAQESSPTFRRPKSNVFWYTLPGAIVLAVLIGLIATGRLQLNRKKMEKIGVPTDVAMTLSGESGNVPDVEPGNDFSNDAASTDPSSSKDSNSSNDSNRSSEGELTTNDALSNMTPDMTIANSNAPTAEPRVTSKVFHVTGNASSTTDPPVNSVAVAPSEMPEEIAHDAAEVIANDAAPPPAVDKLAIPPAELVNEGRKLVEEIYQEKYKAARTNEDKTAIAKQMISVATQTNDDPAGRFALLEVARKIALSAYDYMTALESVQQVADDFENINALQSKIDTLREVKSVPDQQKRSYADAVIMVARESLESGEFAPAQSLCLRAESTVGSRAAKTQIQELRQLQRDLTDAEALFNQYTASRKALESAPDDQKAKADVGLYLCCVNGRWDEGLALLAVSGATPMREASIAELTRGESNTNDFSIAEKWFAAAGNTESALAKRRFYDHAKTWFESAQGDARGLELVRIERRLEELKPLTTPTRRVIDSAATFSPGQSAPSKLQEQTWTSTTSSTDFARIEKNVIKIGMGDTPSGIGEACAGFELSGATKIEIVGRASHGKMPKVDNSTKTGFVIDYRTAKGYEKRVFLSHGAHVGRNFTAQPPWGCGKDPDTKTFKGRRNTYRIDILDWAPPGWDGTCWFSVYMQNAGQNRSLTATVRWNGPSK